MTKSRLLLFFLIIACTIVLYMLPRYVVDNDQEEIVEQETGHTSQNSDGSEHTDVNHNFAIPDSMVAVIGRFYDSYINAENQEKRFIFADSLAKAYNLVGKLDSSAKYLEIKAIEDPSLENLIVAGGWIL